MTQEQKDLFGKALFDARKQYDCTQVECARFCDVSVKTYQSWERGVSTPKPDKLDSICDFLNLDSEMFV